MDEAALNDTDRAAWVVDFAARELPILARTTETFESPHHQHPERVDDDTGRRMCSTAPGANG